MLKRVAVVGLLVLLAAAAPMPNRQPSQPPIPSAIQPSNTAQTPSSQIDVSARGSDRGTEKRPLIVEAHSAPQNQAEADKDATYQLQRAAAEDAHELSMTTFIVGIFQTIALFATVFAMAFVAVRQLRAYVYPNVIGLKKFSLTEPSEIVVEWKNAGNTPAKDFECNGVVWIAERPLHHKTKSGGIPREPTDTGKHSRISLYPGQDIRVDYTAVPEQIPIPPAVMHDILEGSRAIYVIGEARYWDVFGFRRRSKICMYVALDDAKQLIEVELNDLALKNFEVHFVHAHILNDFT